MAVVERKYVLTKIRAGDYLLPSNDGSTIWRIRSYIEGPSSGLGDLFPADKRFWGVWRWVGPGDINVDDDLLWEHHEEWLESRAEAIQVALKA